MDSISVTLKTVTPLFLTGADGKTPELRAPSIKGMMRFWWRAMNGHLSIEELRKKEGELFGSSDEKIGRSKFAFKILCSSNLKTDLYEPVPTKTFTAQAFVPELQFTLLLTANSNFKEYEIICNVLKVSLLLGGFGKRSRRGFGSIKIVNINDSDFSFDYSPSSICNLLNTVVSDGFEVNAGNSKIKRKAKAHVDANYPYIDEIEIGDACKNYHILLKEIGKASHNAEPCDYTGFAGKNKRLASPIYVSIVQDDDGYKPIITTLNAAFESGHNIADTAASKRTAFISHILSAGKGCGK